jgi:hypothetical protein
MKKRTERALLLGALSLAAIKAQKDGAAMSAREAARLREALERTYLSDWGHVPEGERPRLGVNLEPAPPSPRAIGGIAIGDRVHVELRVFQGDGVVFEISTELARGDASLLYPCYRIRFDDGLSEWFTGACLTLI